MLKEEGRRKKEEGRGKREELTCRVRQLVVAGSSP